MTTDNKDTDRLLAHFCATMADRIQIEDCASVTRSNGESVNIRLSFGNVCEVVQIDRPYSDIATITELHTPKMLHNLRERIKEIGREMKEAT